MSLPAHLSSPRTRRAAAWLVVPVTGLVLYLILVPQVPDFAAQATRAMVFHKLGSVTWWPGWFGGLELPTYSVLAPALMGTIGVASTGAIAAGISMWFGHLVVRGAERPRAASTVFSMTVLLNLFGGRITFLVGLAFATVAVWAMVRRQPTLAAVATVVSVLGSPLAGLFTGVVAAAVFSVQRSMRREAVFVGGATAVSLGVLAALFHDPGVMGAPITQIAYALCGLVLVAVACRQPTIRAGVLIVGFLLLICLLVPNSVGLNMTRMVWLLAGPLIVGYGHRPDKLVVVLTGLALVFPVGDVWTQLAMADSPSASSSYYEPLLGELQSRMSVDPGSIGQRVEVAEPQSKGAARYVGESMSLARGWERQADMADNPIFYTKGALTPASYRQWLDQLAVAYVAIPSAKLDYASVGEADLVSGGLSYLTPVWSNADWQLYRVDHSAPLVRNAQVLAMTGNQLRLQVLEAGRVPIAIRWSDHLAVLDGSQVEQVRAPGCLARSGDFIVLHARRPGVYVLTSDFDVLPDATQTGGPCARKDG